MSYLATNGMHDCQANSLHSASSRVPRPVDLLRRSIEQFRRHGLLATLGKVVVFVTRRNDGVACQPSNLPESGSVTREQEVLNLKPGQLVEVRPIAEIRATLDQNGKHRGLAFLSNMEPFCGKRFRVFTRMETLYQEESRQVRRLRNTVLLAGVQCDGLLMRCDRSCYFYWREAWLRTVDDPTANEAPANGKQT